MYLYESQREGGRYRGIEGGGGREKEKKRGREGGRREILYLCMWIVCICLYLCAGSM